MLEKILLLEDQAKFREEVRDTLEDADKDYHIIDVGRPEDAIECARCNHFDLFITDVRMAGYTDGIGVLGDIKEICPSIYSIVMTGFTDDEAPVRAMKYGADFFIYKPFETARFLSAVDQVLATKNINETIQSQVKDFFASARRTLLRMTGKEEVEPPQLERDRLRFFKAYYAAIQSANLTLFGALRLWDQLVGLELEYDQNQQILGESAAQLALRYRELLAECENYTQSRKTGRLEVRKEGEISRELFQRFYDRVQVGSVTGPTMVVAPLLWQLSKSRNRPDNPNLSNLWNQLFGDAEKARASKELFDRLLTELAR